MPFEPIQKNEIHRLGFGHEIESRACRWLEAQDGYCLLERNFRSKGGEIDLIFEQQRQAGGALELKRKTLEIVFVEVRARSWDGLVSGLESVGPKKRQNLARAARAFLARYRGRAQGVRFDIVDWDGRRFLHVMDAFRPEF
jgi:Holliday junction resolvase-like predicted endonuclease